MISRSTLLHLRIPFSAFLMPVFCFAASQTENLSIGSYLLVWAVIHLFLYPASNGFNSYYDRDKDSIGGLEKPPEVTRDLLFASLIFDFIALAIGLWINIWFAIMLFVYGLASKAYSHPAVRFKRYPISGLLIVSVFQGGFTYLFSYLALNDLHYNELSNMEYIWPASICSLMLLGSYPMTQIYQHEEDSMRGDLTLSRLLGIQGTFLFTALFFGMTNVAFYLYFTSYHSLMHFVWFQVFLLPTLLFFGRWYLQVRKDPKAADFKRTMRLNQISSVCMIAFFTFLLFWP